MLFRSDRKSTRLNSSHTIISYAVFCLKKKKTARVRASLLRRRPHTPHTHSAALSQRVPVARHRRDEDKQRRRVAGRPFFFLIVAAPPELAPLPPPAPLRI